MPDTVELTMADGVRLVVPDSLGLLTPYVLREQQDCFEDELDFVRRVLEPGQNVIDIGANYGIYTLPMAQKVAGSGHVWAFEPSSSTAQLLAQSIEKNGFRHVTLERMAVSHVPGSAQLGLHIHSELRSLVKGPPPPGGSESVLVTTLDECMDRLRWRDIDFIKIDAEGEETNILRGGLRFFEDLAPLVQYELRSNAANMNLDLARDFKSIGYDSYRLVLGLNVLVPFDAESPADSYLLNLFACKPARAAQLSQRGLLLRANDLVESGSEFSDWAASGGLSRYHWAHVIAHLPYAGHLLPAWEMSEKKGNDTTVQKALALYARSLDRILATAERFRALEASFLHLKALCIAEPSHLRLASLARVAHDYGWRSVVVDALNELTEIIRLTGTVDRSEPFLAPLARFDAISPGNAIGNWVLAAVLEQLELRERFSSFYAGAAALERLEAIQGLGFGSPEMARRLELVRLCISRAQGATDASKTFQDRH